MKLLNTLKLSMLSAAMISTAAMADTTSQFNPEQQKQIETIVRQYLIKNPEVLIEVSQALQKKQRSDMLAKAQTSITRNADALFSGKSPVVGNDKGNVTLVEFFDYQCVHCKKMAPVISSLLKQDSNLRVVYIDFPIFGKSSEVAARAALAAKKQGKYEQLHNELIAVKQKLSPKLVMQAAQKAGLDMTQLTKDMESADVMNQLKANMQLAENMKLMGTPAFVIAATPNGKYVAGGKTFFIPGAASVSSLKDLIGQASAPAKKPVPAKPQ